MVSRQQIHERMARSLFRQSVRHARKGERLQVHSRRPDVHGRRLARTAGADRQERTRRESAAAFLRRKETRRHRSVLPAARLADRQRRGPRAQPLSRKQAGGGSRRFDEDRLASRQLRPDFADRADPCPVRTPRPFRLARRVHGSRIGQVRIRMEGSGRHYAAVDIPHQQLPERDASRLDAGTRRPPHASPTRSRAWSISTRRARCS